MTSDSQIKVSVIIPVYNVEKYLRQCLDSVVNQTLNEIEIICVNDGSTDNSPAILKEYAAKDSRIIIFMQENVGAGPARNVGIQRAQGEFVAFMDPDDWYPESDILETLHTTAKAERVNICGGSLEEYSPDGKVTRDWGNGYAWGNSFSKNKKIQYKDYPYDWHYQRFLFSRKLLVDNNCFFPDFRRYQDPPFFVKAMVLSREFYALKKITYAYRSTPKTGIWEDAERTTHVFTAMRACIGLAKENNLELLLQRYLECLNRWNEWSRKALASEKARRALMAAYAEFPKSHSESAFFQCWDFFINSQNNFPMGIVISEMIKFWDVDDIILSLSQKAWNRYPEFAQFLRPPKDGALPKSAKYPRTIVFYYRCISNGGAQRVVANLCNLFAQRKNDAGEFLFNVICVTDSEYDGVQAEYPLLPNIKRATVPAFEKSQGKNFQKRFHAWRQIISDYAVDVVVSGLWTDPCTFWDALCVKTHPSSPSFIVHSHSYNMVLHLWGEEFSQRVSALYGLSDGVVVLSDCDRRYAEKCNSKVHSIVNPLAFDPTKITKTVSEKNAIVWVGRISPEKRPEDAVKMMAEVVEEVPDAKLYLVGGGNESTLKKLKALARKLKLDANIEFVGFTQNVGEFYRKASVFISTSEYEGFPVTFGEAMAHGIPIATYDMPWLTFLRDGRGFLPVERLNPVALAREVVRLLKDPDFAKNLGELGRKQITEIHSIDIVEEWKKLLGEIDGNPTERKVFSAQEAAELDAINEYFIKAFCSKRSQAFRPRTSLKLTRILVRLFALFIPNKAARKRFREKHLNLTPKGRDVNQSRTRKDK